MPLRTSGPTPTFLYLFQVHGDLPGHLQAASGPDSAIRFLSYGARSADPRSIFYPSSSWTQGRNRLLRAVLDTPAQYIIFGDGDVRLERMGSAGDGPPAQLAPWRAFEHFLMTHEPAVGVPNYFWHLSGQSDVRQPVETVRFFDPVLNAFHRDALLHLLPYCDLLEEESTDYSGSLVCSLAADLYPGRVLQTNRVRVLNPDSLRGYTERLLTKAESFYLESVVDPAARHAFRRQPEWSHLTHPSMGPVAVRPPSYTIAPEVLAQRYDLSHPFWTRRRELLDLPESDPFYADDDQSPRARRWRERSPGRTGYGSGLAGRLSLATRSVRVRLGLVRTNPLVQRVLALRSWRQRAQVVAERLRWGADSRRRAGHWHRWRAGDRDAFSDLHRNGTTVVDLVIDVLTRTGSQSALLVDVGTGTGEVLGALADPRRHVRPVVAIGIDPAQTRGFSWYSGYVLGRVDAGAMTLADVLRQYGVADRDIHWLRIAAGDVDATLAGLGEAIGRCLFVTVPGAAQAAPSPHFRWAGHTPPVPNQAPATTFINIALLDRLWPPA